MTGTIKRIVETRGFGFIEPTGSPDDVFFHCSVLKGLEWNEQLTGQRVDFDPISGRDGRPRACNVRAAE